MLRITNAPTIIHLFTLLYFSYNYSIFSLSEASAASINFYIYQKVQNQECSVMYRIDSMFSYLLKTFLISSLIISIDLNIQIKISNTLITLIFTLLISSQSYLKRICTIVMQQTTNPKVSLLNGNSTFQMQNFPKIQKIIQQQQQSNSQLPEIFNLGGNITLNKALYYQRKNKLTAISESPIIQISDLSKTYELEGDENVIAIKQITLKGDHKQGGIKAGQFVIIRGPSGGGKTTFLNLIGTIDTPSTGTILVDGHVINQGNKDAQNSKLRRDKIGIVFQTFNLLALMSAFENIELPMRIKGQLSQQQMRQRTKLLLKRVGLLQRADHLPSQLSGGQQQRVAIARSLANSPAIILLDQPTGDLDSKSTIEIMNLILQINNFGYSKGASGSNYNIGGKDRATIVMVTHNQDLECYGDRIIFFEDGKIKKQVVNEYQFALDPEQYSKYLNTKI